MSKKKQTKVAKNISQSAQLRSIVKDIMENTFKLSVPLKVDIEVGNDWYEAK